MAYRENLHWQASPRAACVSWAEWRAADAWDQWAAAAAWADQFSFAEFAAVADELAVPAAAAEVQVYETGGVDAKEMQWAAVAAAAAEVQVHETGGAVAEEMLRHCKDKLVLNIPAECVTEAQVLAACLTIDMAAEQYLCTMELKSCEHILPKARDVIVSLAAVAVGFTNHKRYMSVISDAFNSREPNWTVLLGAQFQHSWSKTTTDMRDQWPDIWMSRKALGIFDQR